MYEVSCHGNFKTLLEVLIDKTTRQALYFFCIQKNIWTSFILALA